MCWSSTLKVCVRKDQSHFWVQTRNSVLIQLPCSVSTSTWVYLVYLLNLNGFRDWRQEREVFSSFAVLHKSFGFSILLFSGIFPLPCEIFNIKNDRWFVLIQSILINNSSPLLSWCTKLTFVSLLLDPKSTENSYESRYQGKVLQDIPPPPPWCNYTNTQKMSIHLKKKENSSPEIAFN